MGPPVMLVVVAIVVVMIAVVMIAVVLTLMPLVLVPPLDYLRRHKLLARRTGGGIQLEAVDQEAVMVGLVVDGKGQLEMARAVYLELEALATSAPYQDGAARAFNVHDLALGDLGADALNGVGDLDIGVADFGRDEECVRGWDGHKARRDRESLQQHGAVLFRVVFARERINQ
jgi:hypothetical protein